MEIEEAMLVAIEHAKIASVASRDVPVGAVILNADGELISTGNNQRELLNDPTAHAEIVAIRHAATALGNWRLDGCIIVVTLEPCTMCASAISNARIARIYYAASDEKQGAVENGVRFYTTNSCFYRPEIYSGIQRLESETIIASFFSKLRKNKL